jgi:Protein of unknown function (DUF3455)
MKTTIAAVLSGLSILAGCATPGASTAPSIPENLRSSADERQTLETKATGVQIYECSAAKDAPGRFEWTFRAPEADLFDAAGKRIGKHYAGPTWESNDGSKVVGEVKARNDAPDAKAIPWLLLGAKSSSGSGVFGRTSSIQRVSTVGGIAPAEACSQAQAGKIARVDYQATYYFYVRR